MRNKLIFLFVLILIAIGFIIFKAATAGKDAEFGKLKILSSPEASIFIDNVAIGKTPYEDKIKEGEYLLKLIPDGTTASGTASWQGKIKVYKNTLTYVDRELGASDISSSGVIFTTYKSTSGKDTGEVEIHTEPAGAIVYLDNDDKGIAPLILADVPKGDHELSVYAASFFRRTQKINIDSNYRVVADIKLAIDESQKKIEPTKAPDEATQSATITTTTTPKKTVVEILDTPLGYLRVREEPTTTASETGRLKPGETYPVTDTKPNWYKITFDKKEGWISAQYAKKKEE